MCRGQFDDALQSWKICAGTGSGSRAADRRWSVVLATCACGVRSEPARDTIPVAWQEGMHCILCWKLAERRCGFLFPTVSCGFWSFFFSPKRSDRLHASTRDFWLGLDLACLQFLHNYILEPFGVYGVCHVILCNLWWMVPHKGQHLKIFCASGAQRSRLKAADTHVTPMTPYMPMTPYSLYDSICTVYLLCCSLRIRGSRLNQCSLLSFEYADFCMKRTCHGWGHATRFESRSHGRRRDNGVIPEAKSFLYLHFRVWADVLRTEGGREKQDEAP